MLLSLLLVFRVFQENSYTAATVRVQAGQRVIVTGPYAWARHPMYSGSIVGYLATPISLGALCAMIPAVLICGMIVVRLLDDERCLAMQLAGYDDYRGPRALPINSLRLVGTPRSVARYETHRG
jgi:protein-S-isoprenylcysteine O-methyltransferase Ste14